MLVLENILLNIYSGDMLGFFKGNLKYSGELHIIPTTHTYNAPTVLQHAYFKHCTNPAGTIKNMK